MRCQYKNHHRATDIKGVYHLRAWICLTNRTRKTCLPAYTWSQIQTCSRSWMCEVISWLSSHYIMLFLVSMWKLCPDVSRVWHESSQVAMCQHVRTYHCPIFRRQHPSDLREKTILIHLLPWLLHPDCSTLATSSVCMIHSVCAQSCGNYEYHTANFHSKKKKKILPLKL